MKKSLVSLLFLFFTVITCKQQTFAQPGALDLSFVSAANGTVNCSAIQPDGKIIIGGEFSNYGNSSRNCIARINPDGSLDASFDPGSGVEGTFVGAGRFVNSVTIQPDGKLIVCGMIPLYDSIEGNNIIRLNQNGSIDDTFAPNQFDGNYIWRSVIQTDGKILVGGDFTEIDGYERNHIARLNTDGSLDTTFNPGSGSNGAVNTIVLQPDGKILIGGTFSTIDGVARGRIARLDTNGSVDLSFNPGTGANNNINTIALDSQNRIIIGGAFTIFNGTSFGRLARLYSNGDIDVSFSSGLGANNSIFSIHLDANDRLYIAGAFTQYQGVDRQGIALIDPGGVLNSTFDTSNGAFAGAVNVVLTQSDNKLLAAGSFTQYGLANCQSIARVYTCLQPPPGIYIIPSDDVACPGSTVTFVATGGGAVSYEWTLPSGWIGSPYSISIDAIAGYTGGIVTLRSFNALCGFSDPVTVTMGGVIPDICLVTVDNTSDHNIIVWEKPVTTEIDSFIVYREMTTNNFQRIGAVPYSDDGIFHDYSANPNSTSYRYRLSTYSCNQEWEGSLFHSSIHLQSLGNGNLLWNHYAIEGQSNPVDFYRVYRDDVGTGNFLPISTTVPGGNNSYTDVDFSSFPDAKYVVDVAWNLSCDPFREITTTRSNVYGLSTSISEQDISKIKLFPNPASQLITIEFSNSINILNLKIYNVLGELVYDDASFDKTKKQISLEVFAKGVYTVDIETGLGSVYKKLVIE